MRPDWRQGRLRRGRLRSLHGVGQWEADCVVPDPDLRVQRHGHHTIEGLATDNTLHPIQQAFVDNFGTQCGFCTPGMILQAKALLDQNPTANEAEIRTAISGNLCRCTGYVGIVKSILAAESVAGAS